MRFLSLLLLLVPFLLAPSSCKLDAFATPQERTQLAQADAELSGLTDEDKAAVDRALASVEVLTGALESGDPQRIEAAMAEAQAALAAADSTSEALQATLARYGELERQVRERAAATAGTWILPGLPPPFNGPLTILGIQAALLLAFDRSRQHLKNMASAAARAKLIEAIRAAGKALGLLHTEIVDVEVHPNIRPFAKAVVLRETTP